MMIIFQVILCLYLLLLLTYRLGWKQAFFKNNSSHCGGHHHGDTRTFSIIIPARNESDNIEACLQSLLNQSFPKERFEILLINDFSEDDTLAKAQKILAGTKHRILNLADYLSKEERINAYKKTALNIAIQEAKNEFIITTDADCTMGNNWLATLSHQLLHASHPYFVAAPVNFIPDSKVGKNWLYYFQSLDFMTMQGITIASNQLKLGNMCNGANMGFDKQVFNEVGGYRGIDEIASGDDMLLMEKIRAYHTESIQQVVDTDAIVATPVQPTFSDFMQQRIRWASKSTKYKEKRLTYILGIVYLFNLSLFLMLCLGYWEQLGIHLLFKIVFEIIFLLPVAQFFNKTRELIVFPFLQPLHIIYIISAGFLGMFGKYKWKGRLVK